MARPKRHTKPSTKHPSQPGQLQTAKAQFSELFRRARTEGSQVVTRQGKEQVVVLPAEQFALLTRRVVPGVAKTRSHGVVNKCNSKISP